MDEKKIKVEVEIPVGYNLVINGTDCKLVPKLPKTWEEFCKMHPIMAEECYIDSFGSVTEYEESDIRRSTTNRALPNRETAEAVLALCQLLQLRNCYNGDWVPDWNDERGLKCIIMNNGGKLLRMHSVTTNYVLAFRTDELRDQFLENFRDLIEIAKPLI